MSCSAPQAVRTSIGRIGIVGLIVLLAAADARAQGQVDRLRDRGEGQPVDMFGTYIRAGEFLFYPFFEYYRDHNYEYKPEEFGYPGAIDFRGRYRASEGLIFLAYGVSDRVALEFEAAAIRTSLVKSPEDPSALPQRIEESGSGDTAARVRWRWNRESGVFARKYYAPRIGVFLEVSPDTGKVVRLVACNVDPRCKALP